MLVVEVILLGANTLSPKDLQGPYSTDLLLGVPHDSTACTDRLASRYVRLLDTSDGGDGSHWKSTRPFPQRKALFVNCPCKIVLACSSLMIKTALYVCISHNALNTSTAKNGFWS